MSISISSTTSSYSSSAIMRPPARPDGAKMAENLFSALDSSGQGYIEKTDLQSAFSKLGSSTSSSTEASSQADELFASLDSDGNGKVTKEEFTDTLKKLGEQLDQQAMSSRLQGAGGASGSEAAGNRPPPPATGRRQGRRWPVER